MSVRTVATNGQPVSTKVLASSAGSTSWMSPSAYVDPVTGKHYTAPTLADLLEQLDSANGGPDLLDHEAMRKLGGSPKGNDDAQWDRMIFQLDGYGSASDVSKAHDVILDTLRHPNITYSVNPGLDRNGKPRPLSQKTMKGTRAVVSHEIHRDQQRGPHFMAYVHTVARMDSGAFTAKSSFNNDQAREAFMAQINANLEAEGLKPLEWKGRDEKPESVFQRQANVDAQASDEFRQALDNGEVPELPATEDLPDMDPAAKAEQLRLAAKEAQVNAATLHARAMQEAQKAKTYSQAIDALARESELLQRIGALETGLTQLQEQAAQAEATNAATIAEQATLVATATETLERTATALESTQQKAAELSEGLDDAKAKLTEAESELATTTEQVEQLEERLEVVATELATVKKERDDFGLLAGGLDKELTAEREERAEERQQHQAAVAALRDEVVDVKQQAEMDLTAVRTELAQANSTIQGLEKDLREATSQQAAMREEMAALRAQAQQLVSEQQARAAAEQAAREAMAAKATAEAQRDARPTLEAYTEVQTARATAEAQRDAMRERLERLLANNPAPGGNGPSGNTPTA